MENDGRHCPICLGEVNHQFPSRGFDGDHFDCPQCGEVRLSREAEVNMKGFDDPQRAKVSAWVRENKPLFVKGSDPDIALETKLPSLEHRAARMLRYIDSHRPYGQNFSLRNEQVSRRVSDSTYLDKNNYSHPLIAIGWNANYEETRYMLREVLHGELSWLSDGGSGAYFVSPKGRLYLENGRQGVQSTQGFCAMWFDPQVHTLWTDAIKPAVEAAGYEPLRIDSKQHNDKIDDAIVASIRSSRFVIADFTGSRGGVFYEAGLAHGLDLPVIFMCREDHIKDLHFDVRQYNCILWQAGDLPKAKQDLQNRIEATLGKGPKR